MLETSLSADEKDVDTGVGHVGQDEICRSTSDASEDGTASRSTKINRIKRLTSQAKAKTKHLLHSDASSKISSPMPASMSLDHENEDILHNIHDDPAFNERQIAKKKPFSTGGALEQTYDTLHAVAITAVHPQKALKSKIKRTTATKLSKVQRPFLSRQTDLEFLEAHDNLTSAEEASTRPPSSDYEQSDEDSICEHRRDKVDELEAHREGLRVAWTTNKIDRVRVVPKRLIKFPDADYFWRKDSQSGEIIRYQWEKWLGYFLIYHTQDYSAQYIDDFDELPFNIDTMRKHVERLVLASEPWQTFLMKIRGVYRWEDPWKTLKWFALYVVLWHSNHLIGFLYAYILYLVIKNHYYPTSVSSLRESSKRALDREVAATKLGELIDKHGKDQWLEPLVDELGPYIQLQLGDIANMLEVFANFYLWKYPRKTVATLIFFATCLLVSLCADMGFCVKIVGFVAGGAFFFCWPISSHYPKYRYLVSPFKWILWDIPTHAEWSFYHLRQQAQIGREQMIKHKIQSKHQDELDLRSPDSQRGQPDAPRIIIDSEDRTDASEDDDYHSVDSATSILEESDILGFRAQWKGQIGKMIIYSSGIRFVQSLGKKERWNISFLELMEMRKMQGPAVSRIFMVSTDQMEFKCTNGKVVHVEAVKERDQAFNSIIGFSNLQWQSLQLGPGKHGSGSKSGKL
ncbi:hypothetical protein MMC09_001199 [Bachmanniomyces sp. S44760]|nr:hypothetical protein [Bachmanniomyces sp. S44760]